MHAQEMTQGYRPRDAVRYAIMLRHFRGAVMLDEIVQDVDLFVDDLGFDRDDADRAVTTVAREKGWL